jgi:hypothetical protein
MLKSLFRSHPLIVRDCCPYLLTQLDAGVADYIFLPERWPRQTLQDFAREQFDWNRLPVHLVYADGETERLDEHGIESLTEPALSPYSYTGLLAPVWRLTDDLNMRHRNRKFRERVQELQDWLGWGRQHKRRPAAEVLECVHREVDLDEAEEYDRVDSFGLPWGLMPCIECGGVNGECLHRSGTGTNVMLQVACRCMNDSRCARCGMQLAWAKPGYCVWDEEEEDVFYVPRFKVAAHGCADAWTEV